VTQPVLLNEGHDISAFDCGDQHLNEWLRQRAHGNQRSGASRTYVASEGGRVVAFYSLVTATLLHSQATGAVRRNMPQPIPALLIGRFALDRGIQGQGAGRALLSDALRRCQKVSGDAGVRAVIVEALNELAASFYRHCGFTPSPADPLLLMITIAEIEAGL
jgi:GNAT superfamily N-acetyltransferase